MDRGKRIYPDEENDTDILKENERIIKEINSKTDEEWERCL
jgi:hypothetical protein